MFQCLIDENTLSFSHLFFIFFFSNLCQWCLKNRVFQSLLQRFLRALRSFCNDHWKLFWKMFKIFFRDVFLFKESCQIYETSVEFAQVLKRICANRTSSTVSLCNPSRFVIHFLKFLSHFVIQICDLLPL